MPPAWNSVRAGPVLNCSCPASNLLKKRASPQSQDVVDGGFVAKILIPEGSSDVASTRACPHTSGHGCGDGQGHASWCRPSLPASPIAAFLSFLLRPPSQYADDGHRRRRSGRRSVCRLCRRGRRRACCRRARAGRSAGARRGCSAGASCACARRPASACCARHRRWSAAVNGRQGLLQRGQGLVSRLRLTLLARLPDRSWYLSFSALYCGPAACVVAEL